MFSRVRSNILAYIFIEEISTGRKRNFFFFFLISAEEKTQGRFESLCSIGLCTVASLFARVSPGYLKSIIRSIARSATLLISRKNCEFAKLLFLRIANYAEICIKGDVEPGNTKRTFRRLFIKQISFCSRSGRYFGNCACEFVAYIKFTDIISRAVRDHLRNHICKFYTSHSANFSGHESDESLRGNNGDHMLNVNNVI